MFNNKRVLSEAQGVVPFVARLLICGIFVQGALGKLLDWQGQSEYMASSGMYQPAIPVLLGLALAIELVGVMCLLAGWHARSASLAMFFYLGFVSVILHNFWAFPGDQAGMMQTQFLKNIAIMGGLLMIVSFGPGRWAIDSS